jgi:hypothetical protein
MLPIRIILRNAYTGNADISALVNLRKALMHEKGVVSSNVSYGTYYIYQYMSVIMNSNR